MEGNERRRACGGGGCHRLYPERSHMTLAEPGWEEVADFVLGWALRNARGEVTPLAGARAA